MHFNSNGIDIFQGIASTNETRRDTGTNKAFTMAND